MSKARISPWWRTMIRVAISSTSSGNGAGQDDGQLLAAGVVLEDPLQGQQARRVEAAGERLVQEEHRGLGHERRAEGDLLLLAGRVRSDRAVALLVEIEKVQQVIDVLHQPLVVHVVEPADGQEELAPGACRGKPGLVGQVDRHLADGQLVLDRSPARQPVDPHSSALGREHARHHAQQCRLAHAVGAEDDHELATARSAG